MNIIDPKWIKADHERQVAALVVTLQAFELISNGRESQRRRQGLRLGRWRPGLAHAPTVQVDDLRQAPFASGQMRPARSTPLPSSDGLTIVVSGEGAQGARSAASATMPRESLQEA